MTNEKLTINCTFTYIYIKTLNFKQKFEFTTIHHTRGSVKCRQFVNKHGHAVNYKCVVFFKLYKNW